MLTVLFTTRNGARTLPALLEALCEQESPGEAWKVIAVNNGSTDGSAEILEGFCNRLNLEILNEERRGQNHARNRGLEQLEGDLVVMTDDDVVPQPDWLRTYRTLADRLPGYVVFGGWIEPAWEHEPPSCVLQVLPLSVLYSASDRRTKEGPANYRIIWGGNMAVRSEIFQLGYRFDTSVGPDGTQTYRMGAETAFYMRLAADGYKFWFSHGPRVSHFVPKEYLADAWILGRARRFGRAQGWQRARNKGSAMFAVLCIRIMMRYGVWFGRQYLAGLTGSRCNQLICAWEVQRSRGILDELGNTLLQRLRSNLSGQRNQQTEAEN